MDQRRIRRYNDTLEKPGPILYWMHRDFRAQDNWGLIHAREIALARKVPLAVVFCLSPQYLDATLRHYDFLLHGVEQTAATLRADNIGFLLRPGQPEIEMYRLCRELKPGLVVTDFDPLRIKQAWLQSLIRQRDLPVHEVDSRNIVPCWVASDHREVGARTIRAKIKRALDQFLIPFPRLAPHPFSWPAEMPVADFSALRATLQVDTTVAPVAWIKPGEAAARETLHRFITERLPGYGQRNDPNTQVCSDLSPYLHFGMIASQRVALEVQHTASPGAQPDAFLEELIVRRELADNFCLHAPDYDQITAFPTWAQKTLDKHRKDIRPYLYTEEDFDRARTHDPLWNAAQRQMITTGKMHSYMRMYWAKKILEWTEEPSQALRIAIRLNDRYALDGRDTNGYAGIAWSIGGVHDRGWAERPIFGNIRYMNDRGAARKFDVRQYIQTWSPVQGELFTSA